MDSPGIVGYVGFQVKSVSNLGEYVSGGRGGGVYGI